MLDWYQNIRHYSSDLTPLEAFQVCLPLAAPNDIAAYDLRPEAVAQTGARILHLLAVVAVGRQYKTHGIAETLQQGWVPHDEQATALMTAALIPCADQELNVTTFSAAAPLQPTQPLCGGLFLVSGPAGDQARWADRAD
jgi:citrate synthase